MYVDTGRTVMNVEQNVRDIGFDGYIWLRNVYRM